MQLGEKDRLRRRAMELTQREQALLEKEQEIDRLHAEASRLHGEADVKIREAERMFLAKQKYIDELESARQEVATREAALDGLQQAKETAIEERREQVRLLEETLAQHSEQLDTRLAAIEAREKALIEREEEAERGWAEREAKLTAYSEDMESALAKLSDVHSLFTNMDRFVRERRQTILEQEAALRRQKEELDFRARQADKNDGQRAADHAARLDAEERVRGLQTQVDELERRVGTLQGLLADARNENVKLRQDSLRNKDVGDTAERRLVLYQQEQEKMEKTVESQKVFILQLQKRIAELEESHYYITNDHSRATLALSKVSDEVSRLLAVVNARSPQKVMPEPDRSHPILPTYREEEDKDKDEDGNGNGNGNDSARDRETRQLFPSQPTPAERVMMEEEKEEELKAGPLGSSFSIHNHREDKDSDTSLDI